MTHSVDSLAELLAVTRRWPDKRPEGVSELIETVWNEREDLLAEIKLLRNAPAGPFAELTQAIADLKAKVEARPAAPPIPVPHARVTNQRSPDAPVSLRDSDQAILNFYRSQTEDFQKAFLDFISAYKTLSIVCQRDGVVDFDLLRQTVMEGRA